MIITLHQTDSSQRITDINGESKFVTLESPDVVINPNYIVAMVDHSSFTTISMVNGNTFSVKESVNDIIGKMPRTVDGVYQAFII